MASCQIEQRKKGQSYKVHRAGLGMPCSVANEGLLPRHLASKEEAQRHGDKCAKEASSALQQRYLLDVTKRREGAIA